MPNRPDRPFGADPADFFADFEQPSQLEREAVRAGLCPDCLHIEHAGECKVGCFCRRRAQGVGEAVDNRGRHRREVPKTSKLARLRKTFWRV